MEPQRFFSTTSVPPPQQPPTPQIGSSRVNQQPQDQSLQFGLALRDLLKKAQGLGTTGFKTQEFNAIDEQNRRIASTSPGLIGASPSVQSAARSAEASAVNPTIQSARSGAQTFSEQLGSFKEGIRDYQQVLRDEEARQDNERQEARSIVQNALNTFGSKGFDVIDPKYLKLAGYDPKTINTAKETIKEREIAEKQSKASTQVIDVGGRKVLINSQTGAQIKDLGSADSTAGGLGAGLSQLDTTSPEYLTQLMEITRGRKAPNQVETLRPIQKSIAVINQLDGLQKSINKTTTDPIIGTLRQFNPYDFDARAIQAQLQATVPNLARGVYGEVGVLTDQDIKNYIQTLPNIKGTKAQNDFVMAMTLKTVQRNLESQLETLASAGYDISGFKNQYTTVKNTVDRLEKELGINRQNTQESRVYQGRTYVKVNGGWQLQQ